MIRTRRIPAAAVSVVAAIALCAASAGPVTARAKDSGTTVSSSSATTGQKILKCKLANRQVTVVATAVKSLAGQHYGVAATTTVALCTTKENLTRVYATHLSLKGISGSLAKVNVTVGATRRTSTAALTTLTTPVSAWAHWLFLTYHVTGTLRTTIDARGKVVSQIVGIKQV
jgi:hypothetical protein